MRKRGRTVFRPFFFFDEIGGTFSNNIFFVSVNVVLFLVNDSRIIYTMYYLVSVSSLILITLPRLSNVMLLLDIADLDFLKRLCISL